MNSRILKWVRNSVIIILVLIAAAVVLFPVLTRTGGSDIKCMCTNNMKQLGTALCMYCEDNAGILPSSYLIGHSRDWNKKDFETFASVQGDINTKDYRLGRTWAAVLLPYMKNKDIIWCPDDPTKDRTSATARVSYYYKAAIDRAWYGNKNGKLQNIDGFENPADQVVFWERCDFHHKDGDFTLQDGDRINVTYMDGHTATKRIIGCGYTAEENPPGPLPRSDKGEPAWFNAEIGNVGASGSAKTEQLWDPEKYCDLLD